MNICAYMFPVDDSFVACTGAINQGVQETMTAGYNEDNVYEIRNLYCTLYECQGTLK